MVSVIFNQYFVNGIAIYLLGFIFLIVLEMQSLKYHVEKYNIGKNTLEKASFLSFTPMRLLFSREAIADYFTREDLSLEGAKRGRIAIIFPVLICMFIYGSAIFNNSTRADIVIPNLIWLILYTLSFIACWRFGHTLSGV